MVAVEVEAFLSSLAVDRDLAPGSQDQAVKWNQFCDQHDHRLPHGGLFVGSAPIALRTYLDRQSSMANLVICFADVVRGGRLFFLCGDGRESMTRV